MRRIVDKLLLQQNRTSTCQTYFRIWRQFNRFVISLDIKPALWEERVTLFIAHLIDRGLQSNSVKSYVSAIKKILVDDGYEWEDKKVLLHSLTRACKLVNDKVKTRLPIQCGLLELILGELRRYFYGRNQVYLEILYKALFALGYYGLLRVGELTASEHVIKAQNIHVASNKDKILVVLYSSKTHGYESRPQKVKITSNIRAGSSLHQYRTFCPFKLMKDYFHIRGEFGENEQFFVFRDGSPVLPDHARKVLRQMLDRLGLNSALYDMHSLRIGRASDLAKFNYSISETKFLGRWKSNTVYKYIRS